MNLTFEKYWFKRGSALILVINSFSLQALDNKTSVSPVDSVLPMLTGLAAILVVIFVLAYFFKKFSNFNIISQNIKVLETQSIGHKEKLMIVQIRSQQFLIGVTGQSINQLGELDQVDESEPPPVSKDPIAAKKGFNSFANIFAKLSTRNVVNSKIQQPAIQQPAVQQKTQTSHKRTAA